MTCLFETGVCSYNRRTVLCRAANNSTKCRLRSFSPTQVPSNGVKLRFRVWTGWKQSCFSPIPTAKTLFVNL